MAGWMLVGFGVSTPGLAQSTQIIEARKIFERRESQGEVIYFGEDLKLNSNDRLVFDEPARVYLNDVELDPVSTIDSQGHDLEILVDGSFESDRGVFDVSPDIMQNTSGQDGQDGSSGEKATDGLKGSAGAHGSDASAGTDGSSGADIFVIVPQLQGDVILISRGGNGGRGGKGGSGGQGGQGLSGMDARVLFNFRGMSGLPIDTLLGIGASIGIPVVGQVLAVLQIFNGLKMGDGFDGFDGGAGGAAGRGGDGGQGGDAGNIELVFASKAKESRIFVDARGGRGGAGGAAGVPGAGGPGGVGGKAGDIWARDGKPGNAGATGARSESGRAGLAGKSGKVKVVETGDAVWLRCYVRYRQMIDLGMDREDALEILRICAQ
jgi:hypothetical protein